MAQEKVTVVATFKSKPGMEKTVKAAIEAVIAPTRAEPGCINYDLHRSADDPPRLVEHDQRACEMNGRQPEENRRYG